MPTVSGNDLTFATGALADGLHVLEGDLVDASGNRTPFRLAVTIESTPSADPPPVERNLTSAGDWTLTVPGGLITVRMPQSAWPTPPTPQDYILVLRVDAGPGGGGITPGTQVIDVTARWALAGTFVTEFNAPLEIVFSNPSGGATVPAYSPNGSVWTTIPPIGGPLPAWQRDGFTRSGSDVHVWTRHLTYFGQLRDVGAPRAPLDLAGVVADDGLTLRWVPATDASGQLGNVTLYVNGESYREFGPTEFEAKLGPFVAGDTRTFTLAQRDAAGNMGPQTTALRAVPTLVGLTLADARTALAAAGFTVGTVGEATGTTAPPGTVVAPMRIQLALEGTAIDLVLAGVGPAAQTQLAFTVAGARRLVLGQTTMLSARIEVSKPAHVTAVLRDAKLRRLHAWTFSAKAGASVVKLRLPARLARPGSYRLTWIARAGGQTVSRTATVVLVNARSQATTKRTAGEILIAGGFTLGKASSRRFSNVANAAQAFKALTARREIDALVVDADAYDARFIADVRKRFAHVRVIALSREPARRSRSLRAGAVLALSRHITGAQLTRAIERIAAS